MKGNEGPKGQNKFGRPSQTLIEAHGLVWAMGGVNMKQKQKDFKITAPIAKEFLKISPPRKQKGSK